jgi:predicted nuclease of predicted toxin-antitoxin system
VKFLVDESVSYLVARGLRQAHQDARAAVELGVGGAEDTDVLFQARVEGRVLITADTGFGRHFALWRWSSPSVILLRRVTREPAALVMLLLAHLPQIERTLEDGALVTLDKDAVRVRSLPIRPRAPDPGG